MKVGLLTTYSRETVEFLAQAGFGSMEMGAGPGAEMNADRLLTGGAEEVMQTTAAAGIEVSAIGHYTNNLDPDLEARAANIAYLRKLVDCCQKMKVGTLCTFAGRAPDLGIEDNIPAFKEVFTPLADYAGERNVCIAFENCPMMHTHPFRGINIAFSPRAWELMFEAVPAPNLGLEYDPSHLYWLNVDHVSVIRDYGERIFHVHAKDTEIMYHRLGHQGIFGGSWWRYRIPGLGNIDWKQVVTALIDAGYQGNLDIEHEDPVFAGERFKEGVLYGLKHLKQFVL